MKLLRKLFGQSDRGAVPDLVCDHSTFVKWALPIAFEQDPVVVMGALHAECKDAILFLGKIVECANEIQPMEDGSESLFLKDIKICVTRIGNHPTVMLALSPPKSPTSAYMVGLVHLAISEDMLEWPVRYFTLEKQVDLSRIFPGQGDKDGTMLCEWARDEQGMRFHQNFGIGPKPSLRGIRAEDICDAVWQGSVRVISISLPVHTVRGTTRVMGVKTHRELDRDVCRAMRD